MNKTTIYCIAALLFAATILRAQDNFCKVWYTQERNSKVQIFLTADGTYAGKLVWIKDGYVDGKPVLDKKNPDETKRDHTLLGLQIVAGLEKKSDNELVSGKIYDPSHGNFYSCKMTIKEPGKLELRGYILGIPFLGKTTTWFLAEDEKPAAPSKPQAPVNNTGAKKEL